MILKKIKRIPNCEIVHFFDENKIIYSIHNKIFININNKKYKVKIPISTFEIIIGKFRIIRRALRLDKCNVFIANKNLIIIRQFKVYSYSLRNEKLRHTLNLNNCRNILHQSMCKDQNGFLYFGEYGNNKKRNPVNIYRSTDYGESWDIIYTFPAGEIKHIHGCYYDIYENKIWTLTGDFENENIIMKSNLDFTENHKIGDGSQKYRAVNVFFSKDKIDWIMDSPIEVSHHYSLNRKNLKLEKKQAFPGPVWYLKELNDGYYLAASSVENGDSVSSKYAQLFLSKDLDTWKSIAQFKKDILPMPFFKWGVIGFADGNQSSKRFVLHFEALKDVDGKSYYYFLENG